MRMTPVVISFSPQAPALERLFSPPSAIVGQADFCNVPLPTFAHLKNPPIYPPNILSVNISQHSRVFSRSETISKLLLAFCLMNSVHAQSILWYTTVFARC